ncbi:hypothetical protein F443_08136 [Phytophthora nicotianae P1569]|uniref:Uncharacterized protein n=2 Tax=Phytophthora nicotianae TaxID=4792 RepID=V9FAA6_PHYNI|nr:hypothetical protein F443_08136 [Phytophthora nicotianae P1569]ETO76420.1 hypothetical protein F444_08187 [Phytophthora nicotianae P1976]
MEKSSMLGWYGQLLPACEGQLPLNQLTPATFLLLAVS